MESEQLKEIHSLASKARDVHNKLTLPWNGDGTGILSIEIYETYIQKIRSLKDQFYEAVDRFITLYEQQKEKEKTRLGNLYNESDYPTVEVLKNKFYFDVKFLPLPSTDDFRVKLQADEVEQIKKEFEQHYNQIWAEATKELYNRLYTAIKHLYDRLKDSEALFKKNLIENIAELVEILPKLNVYGEQKLNELTQLVAEEFANLDPDDLRKDKEFRQVTSDLAEAILKDMETLL